MADSPTKDRPRQVTVGAWVVGAASVAMLLSVGSVLARLHTVDLRQGVAEFLSEGSGRSLGLGIDVDHALTLTRIGCMVLGAVSAAMLVFAFFAARRDRSARIALSVLAVPLLVCGLFVDVFLTGFILAATVLLWTQPARDWYAGRAPRAAPVQPPAPPSVPEPVQAPSPYAGRYGEQSAPLPPPREPSRSGARPRTVASACVLTWGFCALAVVFLVVGLASLGSSQVHDQVRTALADNPQARELGLTVSDLTLAIAVVFGVFIVWAVLAAGVAVLAFLRHGWARVVLIVSAIAAGLVALVGSIGFPGFLIVAAACGATVAMLVGREASNWFRRAR